MLTWLLRPGDPTGLFLAADARVTHTNYFDDQIWELTIGRGAPVAINLQTNYGLRARSLRVFPRFTEGDLGFSDPDSFASPIKVEHYYPNSIQLLFAPFLGINAQLTYWIPESNAAAGQIIVSNVGETYRKFSLEWVVLLVPGAGGERMAVRQIESVHVLTGNTQSLHPVFFVTGGAKPGSGSFPSLVIPFNLSPGESQSITWALASLGNMKLSFDYARTITTRNWAAELARLNLLDSSLIDIHTGDESWNTAFAMSQRVALSLAQSPTSALPHASFVTVRQPDYGYSIGGDGSDFNHLWNGQTALDAYYLAEQLLITNPTLIRGIIENFLSVQAEDGSIDAKPGLGGQRARLAATPILASLAWKVYEQTAEIGFLEKILEPLTRFYQSWFTQLHDQDQDRIPEWSNVLQTGLEDHPIFGHRSTNAQGVDPTCVECPDLCAYLYRENITLQRIAKVVHQEDLVAHLISDAERLQAAVLTSWNSTDSCYHYWDRESHLTLGPTAQIRITWPEIPNLPVTFFKPIRLLVRITSADGSLRRVQVYLHGSGSGGGHLVEPLTEKSFFWQQGTAQATSRRIFTSLDHLDIQGLGSGDILEIQGIVLTNLDITLLLPLWAGIPFLEQAEQLVQQTIVNPQRFWKSYGIASVVHAMDQVENRDAIINLPLNVLVAEGLLRYGFKTQAANLVNNLMLGITQSFAREGVFRYSYQSDTGIGIGERNALQGLAPVNLFLRTLGIQIISPHEINVSGFNPYPWPVTVKYRGITILCQRDRTTVVFSDGQTITASEEGTHKISMDRSRASRQ
jgi:hypothetical protein